MALRQPLIDRWRHQEVHVAVDQAEVAHVAEVRGGANCVRPILPPISRRVNSDRLLGGRSPRCRRARSHCREVVVSQEDERLCAGNRVDLYVDHQRARRRVLQPVRRVERAVWVPRECRVAVRIQDDVSACVSGVIGARLDRVLRRREDVAGQMLDAGIRTDQLRERAVLERLFVAGAFDARQVVQPVAVLQSLHLGAEDVTRKLNQQAAEQVLLLGQAADPHVDLIEAGDRAGTRGCWVAGGVMGGPGIRFVVGVGATAVVGRVRGWQPAPG